MDTEFFNLRAMLQQEESCYQINDFFQKLPPQSSESLLTVDIDARKEIAQWCISVVKVCEYSAETAAIIMSSLDRFVSTPEDSETLLDRFQYQLAALTAIYLSAKIHCARVLSSENVAKLSRGAFTAEDVEAMERGMLKEIQWRVSPPTAMNFVRIYLDLLTLSNNIFDRGTQDTVLELVGYQTNLSIVQFEISTTKASQIAKASLLIAVENIYSSNSEIYETMRRFLSLSSDIDHKPITYLMQKLSKAIPVENGVNVESQVRSSIIHRDSFPKSPRSVYKHNLTIRMQCNVN